MVERTRGKENPLQVRPVQLCMIKPQSCTACRIEAAAPCTPSVHSAPDALSFICWMCNTLQVTVFMVPYTCDDCKAKAPSISQWSCATAPANADGGGAETSAAETSEAVEEKKEEGPVAVPEGLYPGWFTRMLREKRTANKVRDQKGACGLVSSNLHELSCHARQLSPYAHARPACPPFSPASPVLAAAVCLRPAAHL